MGRPLFLEGEAGVGKTEIAKVLAATLGRRLIRLQCYEGLDVAVRGLRVELRRADDRDPARRGRGRASTASGIEHDIFSERFLIKRPLLQALEPDAGGAPVLLIDELDRTDEAFEAFLLEVLSDFQVTIPELGTVKAEQPPIVVITSNRTREIHDALKRRCLYHWVDYPDRRARARDRARQGAGRRQEAVAARSSRFVQALRKQDLFKSPGVAETLDWATALAELDAVALDPATVSDTLGVLLKYQDDIARIEGTQGEGAARPGAGGAARGGVSAVDPEVASAVRALAGWPCQAPSPLQSGHAAGHWVPMPEATERRDHAAASPRTSSISRARCAPPALPVGPGRGARCARSGAGGRRRHTRRISTGRCTRCS